MKLSVIHIICVLLLVHRFRVIWKLMGKRKLKSSSTKNFEQKAKQYSQWILALLVLVPLKATCLWLKFQDQFMPMLWLQNYLFCLSSCKILECCLHTRHVHWCRVYILVLNKLENVPTQVSVQVTFLLTIVDNFLWALCSNGKEVDQNCKVICATPHLLNSVAVVEDLLKNLDSS